MGNLRSSEMIELSMKQIIEPIVLNKERNE